MSAIIFPQRNAPLASSPWAGAWNEPIKGGFDQRFQAPLADAAASGGKVDVVDVVIGVAIVRRRLGGPSIGPSIGPSYDGDLGSAGGAGGPSISSAGLPPARKVLRN